MLTSVRTIKSLRNRDHTWGDSKLMFKWRCPFL